MAAAGIFVETSMSAVTRSTWDRILNINLRGSALLAIEAGNAMSSRGGGRIVLISSVNGMYSERRVLDYNAAKAQSSVSPSRWRSSSRARV